MRVKITETVLRDAHQSLLATRMRTRDMLEVVEQLDQIGYFSLEMWGVPPSTPVFATLTKIPGSA